MAVANNTEIPSAGTPQDDNQQQKDSGVNNNNNNPSGAKLYMGKYTTLEEAVEHGYGGLAKGQQEINERLASLTQVLEHIAAPTVPVGYNSNNNGSGNYAQGGYAPQNGYNYDPYGRGPQPREDEIDPTAFITNPGAILRQREERLVNAITQKFTTALANASVLNDFKAKNPDLLQHEVVFAGHMHNLDPRLPLATRLDTAAKATRAYLASLKMTQNRDMPDAMVNNGVFTPAPTSNMNPNFSNGGIPVGSNNANEDTELAQYIQERQSDWVSHFGVDPKK